MDQEKTGSFICGLRKEMGLTQAALAERLHVSDKAVSRWETGRGFPDINSLETLAEELNVSVAELLKGERFSTEESTQAAEDVTETAFSLARAQVRKKRWLHVAAGFLLGAIVLLLALVHLNSPIPIPGARNALTAETLPDGRAVLVLKEEVTGSTVESVRDPDSQEERLTVSCYYTEWDRLTGKKRETAVILPQTVSFYYYPSEDGGSDEEIMLQTDAVEGASRSGGVQTLPRLVYRYWLLLGALLTVAGAALWLALRKKRCADAVLKAALVPAVLTVSLAAVVAGKLRNMYDAAWYFSGTLLLAVLLYCLCLVMLTLIRERRKMRRNEEKAQS